MEINGDEIEYIESPNPHAPQEETEKVSITYKFYKALFDKKITIAQAQATLLRFTKKLSEEQKQKADRPLSLGELTAAVKKLGNDKSPGPDGLSSEFLQGFWELLGQDLLDALNSSKA